MTGAGPGGHPEQDVLADLTAGALPTDQARQVEAHVLACPACEQLLADSEQVRLLLTRSPDPGPMPPPVWLRIEGALRGEAEQRAARLAGSVPVPTAPPVTPDEAPTAAWKRFTEAGAPTSTRSPRANRGRSAQPSRRELLAQDRAARRGRRPLMVAAAAVAVLGLAAATTVLLRSGTDSSGAATDVLARPRPATTVYASGREYTAATLVAQAKELLHRGSPAGTGSIGAAASVVTAPASPGTVADPQRLQACLVSLGVVGRHALAVDLARYQGREAAVIVVPGAAGGSEVWVVARDCRPGDEGQLAFKTLPA